MNKNLKAVLILTVAVLATLFICKCGEDVRHTEQLELIKENHQVEINESKAVAFELQRINDSLTSENQLLSNKLEACLTKPKFSYAKPLSSTPKVDSTCINALTKAENDLFLVNKENNLLQAKVKDLECDKYVNTYNNALVINHFRKIATWEMDSIFQLPNFYAQVKNNNSELYSGFDLRDSVQIKVTSRKGFLNLFGKREYTIELANDNELLYEGKAELLAQSKKDFIIGLVTRYSWEHSTRKDFNVNGIDNSLYRTQEKDCK